MNQTLAQQLLSLPPDPEGLLACKEEARNGRYASVVLPNPSEEAEYRFIALCLDMGEGIEGAGVTAAEALDKLYDSIAFALFIQKKLGVALPKPTIIYCSGRPINTQYLKESFVGHLARQTAELVRWLEQQRAMDANPPEIPDNPA